VVIVGKCQWWVVGACPSDVHSSTRESDPGKRRSPAVDGQDLKLEASSFSMSVRLTRQENVRDCRRKKDKNDIDVVRVLPTVLARGSAARFEFDYDYFRVRARQRSLGAATTDFLWLLVST
jgi:hypothetical protein